MEDIEDMFVNQQASELLDNRRPFKKKVDRKTTAKPSTTTESDPSSSAQGASAATVVAASPSEQQPTDLDSNNQALPGQAKVFVKTYGCSHNISDSEYMAGMLQDQGYSIVNDMQNADVCLINSCTVKNPSEVKFVNLVAKAQEAKKPVVVSGCVPQGDRNLKGLETVSILGVTQIDRVVEVVEEALQGNVVRLLAKKELPALDMPKIRKNKLVEIIPLSTGCLGSCTYCKTRHARGKLGSYDPQAIVDRAKQAVDEGVMEIWLTSEDTGAYGRDINTNLPDLLRKIVAILPEHAMLRLGMTNPPYILEHLRAIADIMKHPRVYQFLHVPVQSGSNSVLDKMNREYTVEEFNEVCDYLKSEMPHMTLATDIICGFPYETKEEHQETVDLVHRHQFPVLNISQFYARPGTPAAKWTQVNTKDKKERSTEVTNAFNCYSTNQHYVGTEQRVWIMGYDDRVKKGAVDSKEKPQIMGHTKDYTKVVLEQTEDCFGVPVDQINPESLIGRCVKIKVTESQKWHISGYITDMSPAYEKADPDYFVKLEQRRKQDLLKQFEEDAKKAKAYQNYLIASKKIKPQSGVLVDFIEGFLGDGIKQRIMEKRFGEIIPVMVGMILEAIGVYILLCAVFFE